VRRDARLWGPDRGDLCPCGSKRRARSCHALKDGDWLGDPWRCELVADPPTGYSHARCYARSLDDCSTKISREHYISAGLLSELEQSPLVVGLPFAKEEGRRMSVASLTSKILCERHNNALSPLDTEALSAFRALRRFEAAYRDSEPIVEFDAVLVNGPRLEAWLLKTAFGFLAAGLVELEGEKVGEWRDRADDLLLGVLFGEAAMPNTWGLWLVPPNRPQAALADISALASGRDGQLWSLLVEFGAFGLTFALGRPAGAPVLHPSALVALKEGTPDAQQALLIGWPGGSAGGPVITTRVGQMEGWDAR
jgi:hypothetical protein